MTISRNNQAEWYIPRVCRACSIHEQVLEGGKDFRSDRVPLFGGPEELGLIAGKDGVEAVHDSGRQLSSQVGSPTAAIEHP